MTHVYKLVCFSLVHLSRVSSMYRALALDGERKRSFSHLCSEIRYFYYLFTWFWLCWVFAALRAFLCCCNRGYSHCRVQAPGAAARRLSHGSQVLERSLSSCGLAALRHMAYGIFLGQGSSPALAGGLFTTE